MEECIDDLCQSLSGSIFWMDGVYPEEESKCAQSDLKVEQGSF